MDYLIQLLFTGVIVGSSSIWFGYQVIMGRM